MATERETLFRDRDGDDLSVWPTDERDAAGRPQLLLSTSLDGVNVPAAAVQMMRAVLEAYSDPAAPAKGMPALIDRLWAIAQEQCHEQGQLPCPYPYCGPCSFDPVTSA